MTAHAAQLSACLCYGTGPLRHSLTVVSVSVVEQALVWLCHAALCCRSTFVKALQDLGDAVTGQDTGIAWHNRFRQVSLTDLPWTVFGLLRNEQCPHYHFVL